MWCPHCREDVPAVANIDRRAYTCPRCGEELRGADSPPPAPVDTTDSTDDEFMPHFDSWELEERLRHIQRMVRLEKPEGDSAPPNAERHFRLDATHQGPSGWHLPTPQPKLAPERPARTSSFSLLLSVAWTILLLATTAIVCGGILMGWSLLGGRPELWSIGLPTAIGGQVALLLGLVLQMDRLRDEGRSTAEKLESVDETLHDLKTTTTVLGTGSNSPSGHFYAHMVDGAGPHVLLSDLKSQLDLLAWKLSRTER